MPEYLSYKITLFYEDFRHHSATPKSSIRFRAVSISIFFILVISGLTCVWNCHIGVLAYPLEDIRLFLEAKFPNNFILKSTYSSWIEFEEYSELSTHDLGVDKHPSPNLPVSNTWICSLLRFRAADCPLFVGTIINTI